MVQLATDAEAVLLVGYDTSATGLLGTVTRSEGLLGGALVLAREGSGPLLSARLEDDEAAPGDGPLARHAKDNAMAPMLPLFEALAGDDDTSLLHAGPGRVLRVEIAHG